MERALKKWMYAVRKENSAKQKFNQSNQIETIDDAFSKMGVYLSQSYPEKCSTKT